MLPGCTPWPAELAARYRRAGYWRGETLGELSQQWTRAYARRTALVEGERRWTYAALGARADRLAAGLWRLGVRPGDRVVVQLPNGAAFAALLFALFRLGALPVMALPAHRRSEIASLCECAGAVALAIPDRYQSFDYRAMAREVRARVSSLDHVLVAGDAEEAIALDEVDAPPMELPGGNPDDVALFLLSGGTTGMPKLIPRTHDDYAYNVRACAAASGLGERDVQLIVLPMAHNGALGCPGVLGSLSTGGTVVVAHTASPDEAFPLIERERVTLTTLVPPLALVWTEAAAWTAADLSSLRLVQIGGAKLATEVARRVPAALGCRLQQWYGMAEGILSHTRLDDPEQDVIATQGSPLSPDDELRIVDDDGVPVAAGCVGHLWVRGPTTFRGYYRAGAAEAAWLTDDGWFRTGDLARLTARGRLVIEGRSKDVINRGGEKIAAEEVESHLLAHPAVRDAALVAVPDEVLGERACVFVIPRNGAIPLSELTRFLRERGLADYKLPDRLELVDAFPLTSVGKVSKAALRARAARTTADDHGPTRREP